MIIIRKPMPSEKWVTVRNHPDYEVSNFGKVRSLKTGKLLRNVDNGTGYMRLKLNSIHYLVHILVADAFLGPKPESLECCHLDGNKSNNTLRNLSYVTHSENCNHKKKHGTQKFPVLFGIDNPMCKLTESDVYRIIEMYNKGNISQYEIGIKFGVSQGHIHRIVRGHRWCHMKKKC